MNSTSSFRVVALSKQAKLGVAASRGALTNEQFLAAAVTTELPNLVTALSALGFDGLGEASEKARYPFGDQTLDDLKEAGEAVGLPAVLLLRLCLARATAGSARINMPKTAKKKPAKKATRKTSGRKAGAK